MNLAYRLARVCFFAVLSSFIAVSAHAEPAKPFAHLAKSQPTLIPGKIEVIEFFWYGCPHCNQLEPLVEAWEKTLPVDVAFRREPIVWEGNRATEIHAKIFLTLRAMGALGQHHRVVYEVIHWARLPLRDESEVFDWAERRGMDRKTFEATFRSPAIAAQLAQIKQMARDDAVTSVPTFIVNGKYFTSPRQAGGVQQVFRLIDQLIVQERSSAQK